MPTKASAHLAPPQCVLTLDMSVRWCIMASSGVAAGRWTSTNNPEFLAGLRRRKVLVPPKSAQPRASPAKYLGFSFWCSVFDDAAWRLVRRDLSKQSLGVIKHTTGRTPRVAVGLHGPLGRVHRSLRVACSGACQDWCSGRPARKGNDASTGGVREAGTCLRSLPSLLNRQHPIKPWQASEPKHKRQGPPNSLLWQAIA